MKILKIILFAIVGIVALALITAIFVKKEYAVEREITINKSNQAVFDYLKLMRNQQEFSVWAKMDPLAIHEYKGTDGTVGAVYSWNSKRKDVGIGEQTILSIDNGVQINYELHFIEPFEARDKAYFLTSAVNDSTTTVKWGFEGKMNYPMNLMLLFMDMEKMLGNDLENGLVNLKAILEK
ncbi:MAG: SRPBCC family protein [Bacteroidales bacterium]|nr:SRPBCC family protein [Bacteroidales bacterium]